MAVLPGKILIVDKDPGVEQLISYYLKDKGYFIISAKNGEEAVNKVKHFKPDLVLFDILAIGKEHAQAITQLSPKAIILITCNEDEYNKIEELGIDAFVYVAKPVKPEVLAGKIEAALRPIAVSDDGVDRHIFGELEINITNFIVYYKKEKIELAKKEFELLAFLATKPGRVFLRHEILQRVWGVETVVGSRTIDVHIRKIRRKLGIDVIKTVKRVGYKFQY